MMNERIRQLYQQASFDSSVDSEESMVEKFAQLIVAECIKLNGKELAMPGHSRMVDVYCEHFGVEE